MKAEELAALHLLVESAAEINSSLKLDEVLPRVARRVKALVNCHLFAIMLWDDERQRLESRFSMRFDEQADLGEEGGYPPGYGICGTVAALRRPVRVADVRTDPRYRTFPDQQVEIRSELAVPLLYEDRLVGVLDLESMDVDAFSEEHEQVLCTLAAHIASALENARLYERVVEEERRHEQDLSMARIIQQALLPSAAPAVAGLDLGWAYVPALELGGDFYDFVRYRDGRLALAVGDVAGKATAAALYGAMAVGMLRGQVVQRGSEPGEMMGLLNEHLCRPALEDRFLAMAYVLYDPGRRAVTFTNAGLPKLHLVRQGTARPVSQQELALGIEPGHPYGEEVLVLHPGDLLVVWTDGLPECRRAGGEALGVERLRERLEDLSRLPAQQVADGLVALTDAHAAGHQAGNDDRTVVVLRVL